MMYRNPRQRESGFSLMELVVVIAIFGLVLTAAYSILTTTIASDEHITNWTRSGKIGESILSQIRRDLQGAVYLTYGEEVFLVNDGGEGDTAADEIHFLTTARVPAVPEQDLDRWMADAASVGYVIKESTGEEGSGTLFRRVKWRFDQEPFDGDNYYPIYERVKGFSIELLDRDATEWLDSWDSSERIEEGTNDPPLIPKERAAELLSELTESAEDETISDSDDEEDEEPLPIPRAVRITLHIYLGDEDGLAKDDDGEYIVERYETIVPILVVESTELDPELLESADTEDTGAGGEGR